MKKRLLSTLLALCMVLALLPRAAHATVSSTDVRYDLSGSGDILHFDASTGTITGCSAGGESFRDVLNIPSQINGVTVTSIGTNAFENCYHSNIIIPDTVTTIDHHAFCQCHATSIHIPDSVTTIGDYAFSACRDLTNINISPNVTNIGEYAFLDCVALTGITIPSSINYIGYGAFDGCSSLTNVDIQNGATCVNGFVECSSLTNITIPTSVKLIGGGAFYYSGLTDITIPSSVTQIGASAFSATKLTSVTIPGSVNRIGALVLEDSTISGTGPFADCLELTSATLSEGVTCIGYGSFSGCAKLTSVTIPKSVTNIEDYAFNGCENLSDIYFGGSENSWNAIERSHYTSGEDDTPRIFDRATIHYNSTGPDGQGGTGEDPKPDPDPDQPIIPDYIDEHIKNYSLKFHLGTAGEVNMDLQWGWSLFGAASNSYNIPLSAAAMMLSASAEHSEAEVKSLLDSLGFKTTDSKNYGHSWMEIDYPGVAFGYQEVNGKRIFAIVIRGTNNDELEDWISDAVNFVPSANNLRLQWENFVKDICKLDLIDIEKNSKFLVTGHSLGGATANALAKSLSDTYGGKNVYAYAFAPPQPISMLTGVINAGAYNNIFNIVNIEDGVTYLPPVGFARYGRDISFHRDRCDGFYAKFKELAGRDFNKGFLGLGSDSAHDTAVYMAYVLTGQLSDTIRVIKCACPVDVEIYDTSGMLVGQVRNNVASDTESEKVYIRVIGDEKYIYVLVDGDYTIKMTGTDDGTMTYSVQDINGGGEVVEEKVYQNVKLNSGKLLSSIVADISVTNPSNVPLYVVDENGEPEREVLPDGQGTEVPINSPDNPDNIYTIIFAANGGTVNPASLTTDANGKLSSLPTPSRNGYTFNGWFTAPSGGTQVTAASVFTESITLYAQWTYVGTSSGGSSSGGSSSGGGYPSTTYSITIPTVSGGTVTVSPKSVSRGATVTITATPSTGYELVSVTALDSSNKAITLTDKGNGKYTFTMPSGKVTVNAVFQPIQPNETETPWNNPFTDISEAAWYYDAVRFVHENGLMNGYDNNTFAPDSNLSRAMLAQILYNKEGRPAASSSVFTDVASDAWYSEAVAWAAARGIVSGYGNGLFGPGDHITREQLAVMLWRYAGEPAATNKELHFNDADEVSGYALDALCWATENGIINGKGGGILDPRGQATRAQVAQMLMNYLKK